MRPFLTRILIVPILALSMSWSLVHAQGVLSLDDLPMLPAWCQTYRFVLKVGQNPYKADPQTMALQAKIDRSGCKGAWHFCWAMARRNRLLFDESTKSNAGFNVSVMTGDFHFVINESSPTCVLIPEIHVHVGEGYALIGDAKRAEQSFLAALKAKPGYVLAYFGLSDLFENQGNTEKAIAVLQQAIKSNPRSSGLKQKLARVQARANGESAPALSTEAAPAPGKPPAATKPPVSANPSKGPTP